MRMRVIVEDFITAGWCKWDYDFENVVLWYQDMHTVTYMCLNISERYKKISKYFATRSGISYKFNWLRPFNISSNFVLLANYDNYLKYNSTNGFSRSKTLKSDIKLDSSGKISRYMRCPCSGGGHIDCSRSGHQGDTSTCLRWFLETLYPYLSPCQISKTCHQVHDSTFIWHIPPLLSGYTLKASAIYKK